MSYNKQLPASEITEKITRETVDFAEGFGCYLGLDEKGENPKTGKTITLKSKLNPTQLRRFFGEVKRQQMEGYKEADFILLKPKLAYAVGRAEKNNKIKDFYDEISREIDFVTDEASFKRFIQVFEAIVAYHKATVGKE